MDAVASRATWIAFRSIVKRELSTHAVSSKRYIHPLPTRLQPRIHVTTQSFDLRPIQIRQYRPLSQDTKNEGVADKAGVKPIKRNAARKVATDHSLHKVATVAQRSRHSLIRGSGKLRHIDPEADTKEVTAYCAAESYDLSRARSDLDRYGFTIDPFRTELFPQVLHAQTPNDVDKNPNNGIGPTKRSGDVFVFPSGCVVTWNVPEALALKIVEDYLPPSAGDTGHVDRMEVEDLEYIEDPAHETSQIVGDTIVLGTRAASDHHEPPRDPTPSSSVNATLTKIAFSSALARSTNLAVLENHLASYFRATRHIPSTLSAGRPLRLTRAQILRQTGELLSIRARLNLYAELTDALPDLFWDAPHGLGLEAAYERLGRALDVSERIRLLNEKMDYASEIAAVLRERLSEKHAAGLEWMIIGLICIEVGFGVVHLWREGEKEETERRTRVLVERWLETQLGP